jgi:RimJ/RimL family protein N-acetyltransferase
MTDLPALESERLLVRRLTLNDLRLVTPILDDSFGAAPAEVRRTWLEWTVRNYDALAYLGQPPYGERAVVLRATGALVGLVGVVPSYGPFETLPYWRERLHAPPHRLATPEIGLFWATAPAQRGKGYATEAARAVIAFLFERFGLARVVATTEYHNAESQAVMRRLGMRIERNPYSEPAWFQIVGVLENEAQP